MKKELAERVYLKERQILHRMNYQIILTTKGANEIMNKRANIVNGMQLKTMGSIRATESMARWCYGWRVGLII